MANRKVCDRCGKEIEYPKLSWFNYKLHYVSAFVRDAHEDRETHIDMCPECMTYFKIWMKNGKKE